MSNKRKFTKKIIPKGIMSVLKKLEKMGEENITKNLAVANSNGQTVVKIENILRSPWDDGWLLGQGRKSPDELRAIFSIPPSQEPNELIKSSIETGSGDIYEAIINQLSIVHFGDNVSRWEKYYEDESGTGRWMLELRDACINGRMIECTGYIIPDGFELEE